MQHHYPGGNAPTVLKYIRYVAPKQHSDRAWWDPRMAYRTER